MKYRVNVVAILVLSIVGIGYCQAPATISCSQSGEWDVLSVMMMQPSFTAAHYHLEGQTTTYDYSSNPPKTTQSQNYVYTNWQVTDPTNNKGKVYYIKDYQGLPPNNNTSTGPYYGYPWDIRLYDSQYIYFWITENQWDDPWSYKEHTNGSGSATADYTTVMAPRCVFPGGSNNTFWNSPMNSGSQYQTRYLNQPEPDPAPYSSQDCTKTAGVHDLKNAQVRVDSTYGGFVLNDDIHGGTIDLTILPVVYTWGCTSQDLNTCTNKEEFEFGIDSNKNSYGWVQWEHWKNIAPAGSTANWQVQQVSVHNHLAMDNLSKGFNGTPYFPCSPQ